MTVHASDCAAHNEPAVPAGPCACPVIGSFLRTWNDNLPDDKRTELLRPLVPRLVGTRGSRELERRRALMCADWVVRVYTPAWLRLAKLSVHADALESLPEITDMAQVPSIKPAIEAALRAAIAARDAAGSAVWDAAGSAAGSAVWDAAWHAAMDAARAAAWDAAWDAAGSALAPTVEHLQQSALDLVNRMIEAAG